MKKFVVLPILPLLIGCNSVPVKSSFPLTQSDTLKSQKEMVKSSVILITSSIEPFDAFFTRFEADSIFQISRIKYPLKYTTLGDEGQTDSTKFISKSKRNFIDLFAANKQKGLIKKDFLSSTQVKIQFQIEDTGFQMDFLFTNIDGKWYLISVVDKSD